MMEKGQLKEMTKDVLAGIVAIIFIPIWLPIGIFLCFIILPIGLLGQDARDRYNEFKVKRKHLQGSSQG